VTGPYVYVVDDAQRLVGVMHRRQLTTSDRRARVGNIMSRQLVRLPSAAPHSAVRSHPAWDEFDMLPVVGGDGVLVGVMRHRSLRRSGRSRHVGSEGRAALAAFLDLGEVYWGGLATAVDVMAGRRVPLDSGGGS
jgi:predicted transcriptional regulator